MNIAAIIPARGGSKGIPGKNVIDFCGKPLLEWSIEQAKTAKMVSHVYVSSDSPEILTIAQQAGATPIQRPQKIATDTATSESALLHAIDWIQTNQNKNIDIVVFLQATSPLRTAKDIDHAIEIFKTENLDSLFSASSLEDACIWQKKNGTLQSITYDYQNRTRRQDRTPCYLENGSIYLFKPDILRKQNNRLGGKIGMAQMPPWQSFEIDSPQDIDLCEALMRQYILSTSE